MRSQVNQVSDPLDSVLTELEQFGKANDASTTEYPRRMLNVTRDTGEFLAVLVRAKKKSSPSTEAVRLVVFQWPAALYQAGSRTIQFGLNPASFSVSMLFTTSCF